MSLEDRTRQHLEQLGIGRLFWTTSEAVVAADVQTETIVLWNPAAERLFGYSPDEAVGMRLDRIVPDSLREAHLAGLRRYRATGSGKLVGGGPVEVQALTKDGRSVDVALTLTGVSDSAQPQHVVAIIRDVSAVKEGERKLKTANDAIRDFVASASHDLRTPLSAVTGFADILANNVGALSADQIREYAAAIVRNGQQAFRLVDDLLTLSQADADAIPVRSQNVALQDAVVDILGRARLDATVDVDSALTVLVDPDHLDRIMTNFVGNAHRHGHPPVTVGAAATQDDVEVWVDDHGQGVPDEFAPRLFRRFARAGSSSQGTGLGLAIVDGLAKANGGEAFYRRTVAGSRFGVRLPRTATQ